MKKVKKDCYFCEESWGMFGNYFWKIVFKNLFIIFYRIKICLENWNVFDVF